MDLVQMGQRLSRLRESHGVSASALAKQMGISRGYLSRLENGRQLPSLVVLDAIGQFFGVELDHFFVSDSNGEVAVHRDAGSFAGQVPDGSTFTYEPLCGDRDHKLAQPFLGIFRPRSHTQVAVHDVEYFRYVLEGSMVLHYEGQRYALNAGDAIYYDASVAHELECTSDAPARVLTIFAKPQAARALRREPALIEGHI